MKDIPFAVLRQLRLPPRDLAAGVRAYIAMSSAGSLVAMLLAPTLVRFIGPAEFVLVCGAVMAITGLVGLSRHRGHREI